MGNGKHVQLRLHPEKSEDEGIAIGVLNHWLQQGYDTRYIITCALLALDGYDLPPLIPDDMQIVEQVLLKMGGHIEKTIRESVGNEFSINASQQSGGEFTRVSLPVSRSNNQSQDTDGKTKAFANRYKSLLQKGMTDDDDDDDE